MQLLVADDRLTCYRQLQIQRRERILMPGLVIDREVLIEAPAEVVWRTITEPDQISQG
jgi:hypothetical protein